MANIQKYNRWQDIGHLCKHYERSVKKGHYSNPDINQDKLDEDHINLAPDRGSQIEYIHQKIDDIMNGKTLRKDAVKMCCWIINTPSNLPAEKKNDFFNETYNFLINRYGTKSGIGEDVCVSCYIHKSESTDHIHFAFLPIINRNGTKSLCAKELIDRKELKSFHTDLGSYLEEKGICKKTDILNGSTQRNSSGRALSIYELKKNRTRERERIVDRWSRTDTPKDRTIGRW